MLDILGELLMVAAMLGCCCKPPAAAKISRGRH
jgi:hypothetical protein